MGIRPLQAKYYGRYGRRVKGAKHAHKAIRASGRVPGQEARAALAQKRARIKMEKELEKQHGSGWRVGRAELGGI